jgi:uncharacterized membrane protein YfcA
VVDLTGDLTLWGWLLALLCSGLQGMSKAGIAGLGLLGTPLLVTLFGARPAIGIMLPLLVVGDVFAVLYYHRHANWRMLSRLVPIAFAGVIIGSVIMRHITDGALRVSVGAIVMIMVVLAVLRDRGVIPDERIPKGWGMAMVAGLVAGITTMLAHAAGPVMQVYFLAMGLRKNEFIGTGAWFFLLVNSFKVPFFVNQGQITRATLTVDLYLVLGIPLGVAAGIWLVNRLSNRAYVIWVEAMTALAALRLVFG